MASSNRVDGNERTSELKSGKVKWFNPQKGFGFVVDSDEPHDDIFVHISSVEAAGLSFLYEGQELSFHVATREGRKAARILSTIEKETLAESGILLAETELTPGTIEVLRECTSRLIYQLQKNPNDLYKMHPAAFEALLARMFEEDGYVVEFNKGWNQADGGVDIIAVRDHGIAPYRVAIQCKRYSRENRITADPIRSLCGVLDRFKAHSGVLATTSFFTEPAIEEARNHLWRVGLRDYTDIVNGLKKLNPQSRK